MAYAELAAALYLFVLVGFINNSSYWLDRVFFKAAPSAFGAVLMADALSRLGLLP